MRMLILFITVSFICVTVARASYSPKFLETSRNHVSTASSHFSQTSTFTTTTTTIPSTAAAITLANASDSTVTYQGGPVLTGSFNIHVFFLGNVSSTAQSVIKTFIGGVGSTKWWKTVTRYYEIDSKTSTVSVFNATTNSTSPTNVTTLTTVPCGKPRQLSSSLIVNDSSINGTISPENYFLGYMSNHSLSYNGSEIYLLVLGSNVMYNGYGTSSCGYHTYVFWGTPSTPSFKLAASLGVVGLARDGASCYYIQGVKFPHSQIIDNTISVIAHELSEVTTDPYAGHGWSGRQEVGDGCLQSFIGLTRNSKGQVYTTSFGGGYYIVQNLYFNGSCINAS